VKYVNVISGLIVLKILNNNMKFSRTWAMPNKDTFSILPIKNFVKSSEEWVETPCFSTAFRV
jgi:hypothetical protein